MRITKEGLYSLRALVDLAFHGNKHLVKAKDIAVRRKLEPRYLDQALGNLGRCGLIGSRGGPHGGYFLKREAGAITVLDVLTSVEGPIAFAPCVGTLEVSCNRQKDCVEGAAWRDIARQVESVLDSVTLEDLCRQGALGSSES